MHRLSVEGRVRCEAYLDARQKVMQQQQQLQGGG